MTSLEAELKTTRKDLALVMNTVDRMVKAQERAAKEKAAAEGCRGCGEGGGEGDEGGEEVRTTATSEA